MNDGITDYATLSDQDLMALLTSRGDTLPREAVDECIRREPDVLPLLTAYLADEANWDPDVPLERWWALLHCIFVLGGMKDPRAGEALLGLFGRMDWEQDDNLADWVAGYWPALFRNKPHAVPGLRQVVEDRALYWFPRSEALECVLDAAAREGDEALEAALDWTAATAADETQDWDFRLFAACDLLNFPRPRHRPLLERLARLQAGTIGPLFDRRSVEQAFEEGDTPIGQRFENPWSFYDPEEIERRQRRWAEEDAQADRDLLEDDLFADEFAEFTMPYVRETPKIGRNDPCPCGSGRKYKKCCGS